MSEPAERVCLDCVIALSEDETWCCADCCAFYEMTDPHADMTGGDDEED